MGARSASVIGRSFDIDVLADECRLRHERSYPKVTDSFGQPALRITHDWTEYDRKAVEYFMKIKRQIANEMGVLESWEDSPTPAYHVTTHDVGLHRMGWDPAQSVVDQRRPVAAVPVEGDEPVLADLLLLRE